MSKAAAMSDVTQILSAIEAGDQQASDQLLPLVYDELRRQAARQLSQEASGQTLQATTLVHEVGDALSNFLLTISKTIWATQ